VVDINIVIIGNIEQLIARFDDAWPLGERLKDQEFGYGQAYVAAVPDYLVPCRVHYETAALQPRRLGLAAVRRSLAALEVLAPKDRTHAGNQQPLREGLGDIIVGTHREPQRLVELVVLGGEEDHRHRAEFTQAAKQLHAVHAGHLDVEHAEIRRVVGEGLERSRTVRIDARDEPFLLKRDRHRREDVAVVVNERDY